MIWKSFSDFWSMGGYGLYVWGSFGVTAALLAAEAFWTRQGRLNALELLNPQGEAEWLSLDVLQTCLGLSPKLGPVAQWGLAMERKQLVVNTENFGTSEPGIFAVGDINTYPGKKKLILCGFHEATLAAFGAVAVLRPAEKTLLQYTTTSTLLHQRLGLI